MHTPHTSSVSSPPRRVLLQRQQRAAARVALVVLMLLGQSVLMLTAGLAHAHAASGPYSFSTGSPNGTIAMASRPGGGPGSGPNQETEAADDFVLGDTTLINTAVFTGLLPQGTALSAIAQVRIEIYRVFPKDSNTARTPQVPTRVNSPSDVAFDARDTALASASFTAAIVAPSFTAANSVDLGIHPKPNQTTGGEGAVTGEEVQFSVTFTTPFNLPADHYFFVPQVLLTNPADHFLWLSAPRPIVSPGTPFTPDLQTWMRNADLDPDWLRIGTDIVGRGAFNGAFALQGVIPIATGPGGGPTATPELGSGELLATGLLPIGAVLLYRRRRARQMRA